MKPTAIFDTEIYKNYFLVSFLNVENGVVAHYEMYDGKPLDYAKIGRIFRKYRVVSFNGINFDIPILTEALNRASIERLKTVANKIILNKMKYWQLGIEPFSCDHIDLIEIAPGIASLKIYGGRLHCLKMQDLPIEPDSEISEYQRAQLREYCENDLKTTLDLFKKLEPQIELREKMGKTYGIDLRSKSDAQMAEAVIRKEVETNLCRKLKKVEIQTELLFKYDVPPFVCFRSDQMKEVLATIRGCEFLTNSSGVVQEPEAIKKLKIKIGNAEYKMGIGGLHSMEKNVTHRSDENYSLIDRDVTSYYPSIILNCGLAPTNMGKEFSKVYGSIVKRRLEAKAKKDNVTADSLKITINGSFGKFGSPYSILYAPKLLIQTTMTGQLSLLMLIEDLEMSGISVVSANTDGIVIKCPKNKIGLTGLIVMEWESETGFNTEATDYEAIYSRDVNNYIAVKKDGGVKLKGAYAPAGLQKNPTNEICIRAVVDFLKNGVDIGKTIKNCLDITKFVTIRQVKDGAIKNGEYLGTAVRWYYAKNETGAITYKLNGHTVPRSTGAKPLMQLPELLPNDIDFDWYVNEAKSILQDIGYNQLKE